MSIILLLQLRSRMIVWDYTTASISPESPPSSLAINQSIKRISTLLLLLDPFRLLQPRYVLNLAPCGMWPCGMWSCGVCVQRYSVEGWRCLVLSYRTISSYLPQVPPTYDLPSRFCPLKLRTFSVRTLPTHYGALNPSYIIWALHASLQQINRSE